MYENETAVNGRREALTVWLTGLPSAGKSTVAQGIASRLAAAGRSVEVLDGDAVRTSLSRGLGFSREDREENMRRVGWVANLLSRNGVFAVCALISPYRDVRHEIRALHDGRFFEVHIAAPPDVCRNRDVKGLYAKHQHGGMRGLTGVDDPYEEPLWPELSLPTHRQSIAESVETLWTAIARYLGWS